MANKSTHIIDVKTKGAKKSQKQIKGVSGALGGLAKQAGLAAAAYFGATALIGGIKGSIDAFGKQELAEKKLEAALGKTSKALLKQASALQKVTMFGDETIIEAQAMIGAFVKDEKAIKAATKATLDLAAAKGFDLVAAADLVSKTLGSSTNALTRYGIQVTGAVGSTERLTSLTENISAVFGGQAVEQADTYAGAMAQLSNSFGDLQERIGEKLAPTIKSLANTFKDLIEIAPSEEARKEKEEFEGLIGVLINVNSKASSRKLAIEQLNTAYQPYLGDLDLEKSTTEDLIKLKTDVISVMKEEIKQKLFSEELREAETNLQEAQIELFKQERDALDNTSVARSSYGGMVNAGTNNTYVNIEAQKRQVEEYENELQAIQNNQAAYEEWLESKKEGNDVIETEIVKTDANVKSKKKLTQAELDAIAALKAKQKAEISAMNATAQAFGEFVGGAKIAARIQQVSATIDAYRTINKIMADPKLAFPTNVLMATAVGATAFANVKAISGSIGEFKAAQYGMNEVVDSPTLIMAGEAGAEQVNITPLEGENRAGGSAGANITFNNPIMTKDFVEGELAEAIRTASRQGVDFGV